MHIITVTSLSQATNVREFLENRTAMVFNKDYTVLLGGVVSIPEEMREARQLTWKFFDCDEES